MATHASTLAWRIPWMEEPGRLPSMGSLGVRHDWVISLSLFTFTHRRRKWQPTPVFLPGESQGQQSLVGCRLRGRTESDRTERTWQHWIIKKAREFQKNIYFCCIDYAKAFDCLDHSKLWKILKEMGVPDHLTCLLRNLYAGQEARIELDMEQQTGSKSGKEYIKAVCCHPAI